MISYFLAIGNREGVINYESVNKCLNFRRMSFENRGISVISIENMAKLKTKKSKFVCIDKVGKVQYNRK